MKKKILATLAFLIVAAGCVYLYADANDMVASEWSLLDSSHSHSHASSAPSSQPTSSRRSSEWIGETCCKEGRGVMRNGVCTTFTVEGQHRRSACLRSLKRQHGL